MTASGSAEDTKRAEPSASSGVRLQSKVGTSTLPANSFKSNASNSTELFELLAAPVSVVLMTWKSRKGQAVGCRLPSAPGRTVPLDGAARGCASGIQEFRPKPVLDPHAHACPSQSRARFVWGPAETLRRRGKTAPEAQAAVRLSPRCGSRRPAERISEVATPCVAAHGCKHVASATTRCSSCSGRGHPMPHCPQSFLPHAKQSPSPVIRSAWCAPQETCPRAREQTSLTCKFDVGLHKQNNAPNIP